MLDPETENLAQSLSHARRTDGRHVEAHGVRGSIAQSQSILQGGAVGVVERPVRLQYELATLGWLRQHRRQRLDNHQHAQTSLDVADRRWGGALSFLDQQQRSSTNGRGVIAASQGGQILVESKQ